VSRVAVAGKIAPRFRRSDPIFDSPLRHALVFSILTGRWVADLEVALSACRYAV
jgi:hypothetical protein